MVQPVSHAASVLHDAKNRFGIKSSPLKSLQMYDCCYCLGHVSCSLTSFPVFTHSSSTAPLLLEQLFSAGRCPSFPVLHHNCQLYCRCQLQAQGQDLPCLLSPCAFLFISRPKRPNRVIITNMLIFHWNNWSPYFKVKVLCASLLLSTTQPLCNPNNNLLMITTLNRM